MSGVRASDDGDLDTDMTSWHEIIETLEAVWWRFLFVVMWVTMISDTNVFRQIEAGSEQLSIPYLIINNEKFIISEKDFKLLIKFLGSEQQSFNSGHHPLQINF